eukprot:superscaffoldBa00000073_g1131
MNPVYIWLVPVVGLDEEIQIPRLSPCLHRGGVNPRSLQPLDWAPWMANCLTPTKIALDLMAASISAGKEGAAQTSEKCHCMANG